MAKRRKKAVHEDGGMSLSVTLLSCGPGRFEDGGTMASFITFGADDFIQAINFSLEDSRKLAVRLLASLRTADDDFADKVLEAMFTLDENGYYQWPESNPE